MQAIFVYMTDFTAVNSQYIKCTTAWGGVDHITQDTRQTSVRTVKPVYNDHSRDQVMHGGDR